MVNNVRVPAHAFSRTRRKPSRKRRRHNNNTPTADDPILSHFTHNSHKLRTKNPYLKPIILHQSDIKHGPHDAISSFLDPSSSLSEVHPTSPMLASASTFTGVKVAAKATVAKTARRANVVTRAGQYDDELLQTAVRRVFFYIRSFRRARHQCASAIKSPHRVS